VADAFVLQLLGRGVLEFNEWRRSYPAEPVVLKGADLHGRNLRGANLSEADLSSTNLTCARLDEADLTRANLEHATLIDSHASRLTINATSFLGADLSRAILARSCGSSMPPVVGAAISKQQTLTFKNCRLRGADLDNAVFRSADFSRADMSHASIRGTLFEQCSLSNVSFADTVLGGSVFVDSNLSTAENLPQAFHRGPSLLDQKTLRTLIGTGSNEFLRKCGLTKFEMLTARLFEPSLLAGEITDIAYEICEARMSSPIQTRSVFISYSHHDRVFVEHLERYFVASNISFWRDAHDLTAGRLESQIDLAIRLNPVVILILSANSIASDWVEWEALACSRFSYQPI